MALSCIKRLSELLREIILKNGDFFFVWIVFVPSGQKNKLESHKKVCENRDFCGFAMSSKNTKI